MKEMVIQKGIELAQEFETIKDLKCCCLLDYTAEKNGIRAAGKIDVFGVGIKEEQEHQFNEEVELDILAPYRKISNQTAFRVLLDHWHGDIEKKMLLLDLSFTVFGLIDEEVENKQTDLFEDLLDEKDSIKTIQRYVLAQKNDTYESIALRYHLEGKKLAEYNNNKPIEFKSLILLPD